jgi:hypothetical protein
MDHLAQSVYKDYNRVMAFLGDRQVCDQVKGDRFPPAVRDLQWVQLPLELLSHILSPLAGVTFSDYVFN